MAEGNVTGLVPLHQTLVDEDGAAARGQTQNKGSRSGGIKRLDAFYTDGNSMSLVS